MTQPELNRIPSAGSKKIIFNKAGSVNKFAVIQTDYSIIFIPSLPAIIAL